IERRHERYEYSAQINICFGLTVAHFYLSKGKNFNETLELEANYNFQSESSLSAQWKIPFQVVLAASRPSIAKPNRFIALKFWILVSMVTGLNGLVLPLPI